MALDDLLSGQTDAMLGFKLSPVQPVEAQPSGCGAMFECTAFSMADSNAVLRLHEHMTAVNERADEFTAVAQRSGHRYLEANEESRVIIQNVVPPEGS
jgi:hypothetical protein